MAKKAAPVEDPALPGDGRSRRALVLREATRARILEAARKVFAEHGFHQTALPDLLEAADVARGTFYLHFDSKEAAFAALLEDFLKKLRASMHPVTTASPEAARDELLANIERALAVVDQERDIARLVLSEVSVPDELRHHINRFMSGAVALIERSFTYGQKLGLARAGDGHLRARFALGVLVEAARLPATTKRRTAAERSLLAREVMDFVLAGVLQNPRAIAAATPAVETPARAKRRG